MTTVLLDTHALYWLDSDTDRLSQRAAAAIQAADDLAVASVSWWELAWLATHGRIQLAMPVRSWLEAIAAEVHTIPTTPAIASTAVSLPESFPGDPADRVIYATALEHGWQLISRDERLRAHPHPRQVVLW